MEAQSKDFFSSGDSSYPIRSSNAGIPNQYIISNVEIPGKALDSNFDELPESDKSMDK